MPSYHTRIVASAVLLCSATASGACGEPSVELTVDLRTDWMPSELEAVETHWARQPLSEPSGRVRTARLLVQPGQDFLRGERVAEFSGLPQGRSFLHVTLRDPLGRVLAERPVEVRLSRDYAITVVMTRDCEGVVCPESGDPDGHIACLGGECVTPSCLTTTPEDCGEPSCVQDSDCVGRPSCAEIGCVHGVCLCTALVEGGVPSSDGGGQEDGGECAPSEESCGDGVDGDCDDLIDCEDPDCEARACDDGNLCTESDTCGSGVCAGADATCDDGVPCTSDACDPATGCTHAPDPASCDDGNACTDDACDATAGCQHAPKPEHSTCGAYNDRCCGGECVDIYTDERHCGGCGLACGRSSLSCERRSAGGHTGATCRDCDYNTDCPRFEGTGDNATCYDSTVGGDDRCRCQSNGGCAEGQACWLGTTRFCYYL